jgi:WD40 repeat protein
MSNCGTHGTESELIIFKASPEPCLTMRRFVATLRAHVAPVYQCAWSADSRLLVSSSKDTTLKVWDIRTRKLRTDLPGHEDEVFAVDWSPDGYKVASGLSSVHESEHV